MTQTAEQKAAAKAAKEAKAAEEKAVKDAEKAAAKAAKEASASEVIDGIEVGDPQLLRPVELPLVIKPTSGSWENEAQEKFAAILNAYAYRNPKKWEKKKTKLVKQLSDLGTNPDNLNVLNGGADLMQGQITYTDKRFS